MIPAELLSLIERYAGAVLAHLPLFAAVLARMSAIAFLAPGLGEQATPVRVRLAAVIAFSLIVAPPLSASAPTPAGAVDFVRLIGAEAVIGLLIGFALRLALFILQIAGAIAAQNLSMSQLFGPGLGHDQETQLSTLLIMGGLAVASANGLFIDLAATLLRSYDAFPIGVMPAAADLGEWAARESGEAIGIAFALSAPFVVIGFIYTLALASVSRAMPQLMATLVGAPAILLAGLILFAATASVMIDRWSAIVAALVADPVGGAR